MRDLHQDIDFSPSGIKQRWDACCAYTRAVRVASLRLLTTALGPKLANFIACGWSRIEDIPD